MAKQTRYSAIINKCTKGFFVQFDSAPAREAYCITDQYCFNTYDEAAAFIKEQLGE